jgi:hypothetical protein
MHYSLSLKATSCLTGDVIAAADGHIIFIVLFITASYWFPSYSTSVGCKMTDTPSLHFAISHVYVMIHGDGYGVEARFSPNRRWQTTIWRGVSV